MSRQALDVVGLAGVAMLVVLLVYAFVMDDGDGGTRSVPVRSVTSSSVPRTEPPTTRMAGPSPAAAPTTSPVTTAPSQQPSTTRSPAPGRSTPAIVDLPIFPADPPAPAPPATAPPATEPPPTTAPPTTEPPATEPPITEPPITEPPITEPPTVELPIGLPTVELPLAPLVALDR